MVKNAALEFVHRVNVDFDCLKYEAKQESALCRDTSCHKYRSNLLCALDDTYRSSRKASAIYMPHKAGRYCSVDSFYAPFTSTVLNETFTDSLTVSGSRNIHVLQSIEPRHTSARKMLTNRSRKSCALLPLSEQAILSPLPPQSLGHYTPIRHPHQPPQQPRRSRIQEWFAGYLLPGLRVVHKVRLQLGGRHAGKA